MLQLRSATQRLSLIFLLSIGIAACGGSPGMQSTSLVVTGSAAEGKTYTISDDDNDTADAEDRGTYQDSTLTAMFLARNGDCIVFEEGSYRFTTSLVMSHKEGICIKGAGQDKTILDFTDSTGADGFSLSHMKGITVEDLTIIDTPGFSIRISDSDFVTLRNMRTMWSSFEGNMNIEVPSTLDVQCNGLSSTEHDIEVMAAAEPDLTVAPTAGPTTAVGTYTDENGTLQQYATDTSNGGYAIYPVLSNEIILDNVVAIGASDAGIYVGQSNDVIIKNSLAMFNVAGYEIENTDRADMFDNRAFCNTGGFLIFDLPGLNQYGDATRAFDNVSRFNNWPNFAPTGGVVAAVPHGTGFLQLGYDQSEIFNNHIYDNSTLGFVFVSLDLIGYRSDLRMDLYPEGVWLHDNVFRRNGQLPAQPEQEAIQCADGTSHGGVPPCVPVGVDDGHDSLLPALVQIKGASATDGYANLGADIVWDGLMDNGINTKSGHHGSGGGNCELSDQGLDESSYEIDFKGKPKYNTSHAPSCRSNFYKYAEVANGETVREEQQQVAYTESAEGSVEKQYKRIHPRWWNCINDNSFSSDDPDGMNVRPYMNFDGTDPAVPPKVDVAAHDCKAIFGADVHDPATDGTPDQSGTRMPPLAPAVVAEFVPGENGAPVLSDEAVLAICEANTGNNINRAALQQNCPKLSHYNLFSNPTDPRSGFNDGGYLFTLTTPLFSDYASKYRVVWLPASGEKFGWRQGSEFSPQETLYFPPGTVIAKTFTFKTEDDNGNLLSEEIVETRLLIHRENADGDSVWEGFAYVWEKDVNGNYVDATLSIAGDSVAASWKYQDSHPLVDTVYEGSTDRYAVPHPNQCGDCHTNDDRPAGDAPIGPKVRLLNLRLANGSNQLQDMIDRGLLEAPNPALTIVDGVATNAYRLPTFNVPIPPSGDDPEFINIPLSADDGDPATTRDGVQTHGTEAYGKEMRARAWLETNCAHCHNRKGASKQTGFFMDVFRRVDNSHGICQTSVVGGSSNDGRSYNLTPGDDTDSIVPFRASTEESGMQMPPLARSIAHTEGVAVITDWINTVLDGSYPDADCAVAQ